MITSTDVQSDCIYRMLENGAADSAGTLLTNMFSLTEIWDSMNRIMQKFLLDTGITVTRTTIAGIAGQNTYALPVGSIRPRRITWTTPAPAVTSTLTQADTWELDHAQQLWPGDTATPLVWYENNLDQQQLGIALAPSTPGTIGVLYVALNTAITAAGIPLNIPDDWMPYITWGTLGELLASDGDSFDPARAAYCSKRYDEGVELARLVLGGS
jgi:hypothetical protein